MKKTIFITLMLMLCIGAVAQDKTIPVTGINDLKNANDSIRKLLDNLLIDSATETKNINIKIYDEDKSEETKKTMIKTRSGTMTIIKDKDGNVRKTIYESGRYKFGRFYPESYLDMGFNRIQTDDNFPDLHFPKSLAIAWYPMVGINIVRDNIGIMTGLGVEIFNFRFSNNMTLGPNSSGYITGLHASEVVNADKVSKSKLTATYLSLPVLLKFNLYTGKKHNRDFFAAAGVNFGVNTGSHTKIVYYSDNGKKKYKNRDDFHLSPFRYGFTVRAGYGVTGVFAHYYMTPLFSNGKGPEVYPYSIGITFRL